jgi:hypothetical protein
MLNSPPPPHKLTCDEPSMAPKRKESSPKSACCTSETRVLLHERDQFNFERRASDKDKPRDVASTLDTCQEKDEIDAGTNCEGKGPSSWNEKAFISLKSGRRKKGYNARRPPRRPCSRHSHKSWTSTAGSPRSRQTILRASRRRSS